MPVPSTITDLSDSAASNFPQDSDSTGSTVASLPRNLSAIIKKQFIRGSDVAVVSSGSVTLNAEYSYFVVTGSGYNITGFSDAYNGRKVTLKFSGALTLVNSASLILPSGSNITTAAGDVFEFVNESAGVWRCTYNYSFIASINSSLTLKTNIADLANNSDAAKGSALVGFLQSGTGAVGRTAQSKLRDIVHINDFNGNLLNAINATPIGGTLLLGAGPYTAKLTITRSDITIIGCGMPTYNAGKTALTGGTILQGNLTITGDRINIQNLGIDCGSAVCTAINSGTAMDGLALTDATRATHYNCTVRDVIVLCQSATAAVHNFLLEGLSDSRFENLHARYGQWGVVMKTINSTADGIYAYACSQAGYTFKSDSGVAGSPALRSAVSNVYVAADDYAAATNGILIYAASSSIADFALSNFIVNGAVSGLKLVCDTRAVYVNLLLGAVITNGIIRGATTYGIETYGAIIDVNVSNVNIENTTSAQSIFVQSDCLGIHFDNVNANAPSNAATNVTLNGRFSFDNLRAFVSGDFATPSVINCTPDSALTFKIGAYLGTLAFSGSSTWTPAFTGLTVVNGTGGVTITGSYVIVGKMLKFRVTISCTGTATTASTASTTFINNLPFTVLQNDTLSAINGVVGNGGVGLVNAGGTNAYTPTWSAYNGTVTISGQYQFQA